MTICISENALIRDFVKTEYKLNEFPNYDFYLDKKYSIFYVVENDINEQNRHNIIVRILLREDRTKCRFVTSSCVKELANKVEKLVDIEILKDVYKIKLS